MDPITALMKFYEQESAAFLRETAAAKKFRVQNSNLTGETTCIDRESSVAEKLGINDPKLWKLRKKALAPLFYDSVVEAEKSLEEETLEDDGLEVLADRIDSPLVARAHSWLKQSGGIEEISRESFYHWFDGTGRTTLSMIMAAINTLKVAAQYPDKIGGIEEGKKMSAKALHTLFIPKKKRIDLTALQLEIADTIYPVIPENTPQEIVDAINSARDVLFATTKGRPEYRIERAGKYKSAGELFLVWRNDRYNPNELDPKLEAEIDSNFCPTKKRAVAIKRVVYPALYKCISYIDSVTALPGKISVHLPRDSPFNIPITRLLKLKDIAKDFAINQVIRSWERKKDWGKNSNISMPELAMSMGMKAGGNPDGVYIWHGGTRSYFGKDKKGRAKYKNTIAYLPAAAFYVKQFDEGAKKLLQGK
ncbi:hypothetical protein KY331_05610 [Candidatus Woesearchaeota archaeon]|nr:hypothetical protein [Candidatus Woesearchaeota archaeon]